MREEDEYDSEGEEQNKKDLRDKYDSEEYIDLLSLLLQHRDTDSGTLLHYATRVRFFVLQVIVAIIHPYFRLLIGPTEFPLMYNFNFMFLVKKKKSPANVPTKYYKKVY